MGDNLAISERRERAKEIISLLEREYPNARIALNYSNPLELLVATMLSAQCTDERVNKVTKELFKKYRTAEDYANADLSELEAMIRPTGFYRAKARNLKRAARILVERFGSKVPKEMDALLELPGVARKTANIVLANAYGVVEGIAVDTHVRRLSRRLGLTKEEDQDAIERDLMAILPKEYWSRITYLLMEHGRKVCRARKPACDACAVSKLCPSAFKVK
ncbi:MAG: endonuclease III [Candidatus Bathyarchaeia archaeon]